MIIGGLIVLTGLGIIAISVNAEENARYIITFVNEPDRELIQGLGGEIVYESRERGIVVSWLSTAAVRVLRNHPEVNRMEWDGVAMIIEQSLPWGIDRIDADLVFAETTFRGGGINVAVIDTGIDYNHPDLGANYRGGHDWVNDDDDPMDDHGHGTHCAGTIAALDNDIGVIGVAPEANLYGLKAFNAGGSGSWSDVVAALYWSIDNGMDVISMSFTGGYSEAIENACDEAFEAGIVLVAATGNSGLPDGSGDNVGYPARLDTVIAVAATNINDQRASFSSTGPAVELAAPGVSVLSTYLNGQYGYGSGTSMACPHVAGTAALLLSSDNHMTNAEVRHRLRATATDLWEEGRDPWFGFGLVNAYGAMFYDDPGDGTPGNPYKVDDIHDLQAMITGPASHYALVNDIDAGDTLNWNDGMGFMPVGEPGHPFTGSLQGRGHTVSGLFIRRPSAMYVGLFGLMGPGARVSDLYLEDVHAEGSSYVGALAGYVYRGSVDRCRVTESPASVVGGKYVGGLVGVIYQGSLSGSYTSVTVTGGLYVGGLMGQNSGLIRDCHAAGSVTGNRFVGGLVGGNARGVVETSFSTGVVSGYRFTGGLVGVNLRGMVADCFWDRESSGCPTSAGGTGRSTAEMMDLDTFSGAGWDMVAVPGSEGRDSDHVWNIVDGETYPFLNWS